MGLLGSWFGGDKEYNELANMRKRREWDRLCERAYREIAPFSEIVEHIYRQNSKSLAELTTGPVKEFTHKMMLKGCAQLSDIEKAKKYLNAYEWMREEGFAKTVLEIATTSVAQQVGEGVPEKLAKEARRKFGKEMALKMILQCHEHDYTHKRRKELEDKLDYKHLLENCESLEGDMGEKVIKARNRINEIVDEELENLKREFCEGFQNLESTKFFNAAEKLRPELEQIVAGKGSQILFACVTKRKHFESGVSADTLQAYLDTIEPKYRSGRMFYDEERHRLLIFLTTCDGQRESYVLDPKSNIADAVTFTLTHIVEGNANELSQYKALKEREKELSEVYVSIFDDANQRRIKSPTFYEIEQPRDDRGYDNLYFELSMEVQELRDKVSIGDITQENARTETERLQQTWQRLQSQDGHHKDKYRITEKLEEMRYAIRDEL